MFPTTSSNVMRGGGGGGGEIPPGGGSYPGVWAQEGPALAPDGPDR